MDGAVQRGGPRGTVTLRPLFSPASLSRSRVAAADPRMKAPGVEGAVPIQCLAVLSTPAWMRASAVCAATEEISGVALWGSLSGGRVHRRASRARQRGPSGEALRLGAQLLNAHRRVSEDWLDLGLALN